ncbi:hypothetical protein TNCV_641581 [Trichonephila clavipes]|nr:hypothetical protein TNCV_641581 [Trichonephila clavipes]
MACDAEDCRFQMLNDDEIVTSKQEESDTVNDETDEDEDNNNESSKGPSNADAFSALETAKECVRFHILHGSYSVFGFPNDVRPQLIRINNILLYYSHVNLQSSGITYIPNRVGGKIFGGPKPD